ncbi:MAG: ABC transporter ATP-binding protein/permease [Chitinophagaceae bacterium]|nr:ABC transporter ATP-binding protein/permease [Chitinophagaceae bacterium]
MASTPVSPSGALKRLFQILRLDKKDISAIYIFAILSGLVQLAMPLGIQTIISFVMAGSVSTSIIILIFLVVLAVFLNGLLQVRQMQITEKVQQKIFVRYSFEFADRLPRLNIEKLDNYYLPELVNRYFDAVTLQKGIEKLLLEIPLAVIQITFGLVLLAFYHPVFIGFGAVLIFIVFLIIKYTSTKGFETSLKASDYKYSLAAWLEELARVIKSFKYSRGTDLHMQRADKILSGYLHSRTEHFRILLTQYWSLVSFKILITAAMLIVGALLLVDQQINIGQFIAAEIVILTVIGSVEKLIMNLDKVYDVLTSVQKLNKVTESETEVEGTALMSDTGKGVSIDFHHVSFQYQDGIQALRGMDLHVKPGQKVCIMGESGAGKSTILRLLTGAFTNFDGSVLVDDVPIANYNLTSLRANTGILLSQQDIFHGTLYENITMGNKSIQLKDITELAERCGLVNFIQSQPKGFDTELDPTGKRLPSKIRQDILLMRALLGKRRLLLLEEPFQHMETPYQQHIMEFLNADREATVLITTENPAIAKACDLVLYVENGAITFQGTWQQWQDKNS